MGPAAVGTTERRAPVTSKAQITKIASRDGVDARVVERDYVLAHIVALLSSQDADARLIFKGGTSLRLLHFEEYRYSADPVLIFARIPSRRAKLSNSHGLIDTSHSQMIVIGMI